MSTTTYSAFLYLYSGGDKEKKALQKVVGGWFGGEYVSVLKTKFFSLVLSYYYGISFVYYFFISFLFFFKIVCYIYF